MNCFECREKLSKFMVSTEHANPRHLCEDCMREFVNDKINNVSSEISQFTQINISLAN